MKGSNRALRFSMIHPITLRCCAAWLVISCLSSCAGWRLHNEGPEAKLKITVSHRVRGDTQEERVLALAQSIPSSNDFVLTKVEHIQPQPVCGMGALLTMMTFGIVPGYLPAPHVVKVEGVVHGRAVKREYRLDLASRCSLIQGLIPESHDDRVLARALAGAIAEDRQVVGVRKHWSR